MSKRLTDISPHCRPLFTQLIEACAREGLVPVVIDTLRTTKEQEVNIKNGVSWTTRSKHLAQPCCGLSHAIDIAPRAVLKLKNWAPSHPSWVKMGELGEWLGLRWGGRWKRRDCPHFEWVGTCPLRVSR